MKTTNEVIEAVREGGDATEDELRYAVQNLSIWQSMLIFDLARAITEDPISAKTKRGLQRAWDNMKSGNAVPLDTRLKGGSYEPGVPKAERDRRFSAKTADAAVRLSGALHSLRGD